MKFFSARLHSLLPRLAAVGLLVGGGLLLRPAAQHLQEQELRDGLRQPTPEFRRADVLGNQLAVFTIGGLRTLAAELLVLDATTAWLEQDWPRAQERWEQITTLCPQRSNYHMRAAYDMSKNAVADVREKCEDGKLTETEAAQQERAYLNAAENFLLVGLEHNPHSPLLWADLARYYEDIHRRPQYAKAVDAYRKALECGAPAMYERWVFYNLCRIRGREQEAYELGRRLYREAGNRTPSVVCLLFVLQNKLNIPQEAALSINELFGSREKAVKELRRYQHNDLRYPVTGINEFLEQASR